MRNVLIVAAGLAFAAVAVAADPPAEKKPEAAEDCSKIDDAAKKKACEEAKKAAEAAKKEMPKKGGKAKPSNKGRMESEAVDE